jgi:hypothetical protein
MEFIIANKVTLTGAPYRLVDELVEHFTYTNPAYLAAVKMDRSTYGIDEEMCFVELTTDGAIILPRGAARAFYDAACRHGAVEIVDNRLTLPEISTGFHGTLRPYQKQWPGC